MEWNQFTTELLIESTITEWGDEIQETEGRPTCRTGKPGKKPAAA
jgi:hypothetical protein